MKPVQPVLKFFIWILYKVFVGFKLFITVLLMHMIILEWWRISHFLSIAPMILLETAACRLGNSPTGSQLWLWFCSFLPSHKLVASWSSTFLCWWCCSECWRRTTSSHLTCSMPHWWLYRLLKIFAISSSILSICLLPLGSVLVLLCSIPFLQLHSLLAWSIGRSVLPVFQCCNSWWLLEKRSLSLSKYLVVWFQHVIQVPLSLQLQ